MFWYLGERTFSGSTPGIAQFSWCHGVSASGCQLVLRAYGTFPHPNVLGGFLAVVLPIFVSRISYYVFSIFSNEKRRNVISIQRSAFEMVAFVLGIIALALTFSRSAWVVGGVGILLACSKGYVVRGKGIVIFSLICILLGISLLFPINMASESVVVRMALNASAISIWKSHPWFGVGLGNFLVALPSFLPSSFIYYLQPVHNIYLLLLSEVGVVGVFCILYFVYRMKKYFLHTTVYSIPMISLLILGLVDHYPLTLQQGQLLLVLVCSIAYTVFSETKTS